MEINMFKPHKQIILDSAAAPENTQIFYTNAYRNLACYTLQKLKEFSRFCPNLATSLLNHRAQSMCTGQAVSYLDKKIHWRFLVLQSSTFLRGKKKVCPAFISYMKKNALICINSHFFQQRHFLILYWDKNIFFHDCYTKKKKSPFTTAWVGFLLSSRLLVPSLHYPLFACFIGSAVHPGKDVWFVSWAARMAPQVTCIERSSRVSLCIKVNPWDPWNKPSPFSAYCGQRCNNF